MTRPLRGSGARSRWALALIILVYLLLGLTYAWATPPLEASDEYKHFPVVQYIQTQGRLPVLEAQDPGRWLQEGAQPPLYYALMAGLTAWIDTGDLPQLHQINEHAFVGNPNQVGNKNLIIHDPQREAFPWQGSVLAIHVIRLASLFLGAGSLWLTARLGSRLFNRRVGLLAAGLMAFNPMFLFVHAAVNNDSLAILLGHAGLYGLLLLWQSAPDPRRRWHLYVGLGLLLGMGLLTKLSLGGLLGLAGLALALRSWQRRDWRPFFVGGPLILLPALAIAGPWLLRNWQLYGDPTAMNVFIAVQGTRDQPITLTDWRQEFGTFYRSFWGLFGGVNVAMPQPFYALYNGLAVLSGVGFILWLRRARPEARSARRGLWLLLAWPLILFVLLLRWNVISAAFQGRLIFPALGALSVIAVRGWLSLAPSSSRRAAGAALLSGAFLIAAAVPWLVIRPTYAYPQPVQTVPQEAAYGPISFEAPDGEIRLVGVEMAEDQSVTPGEGMVEVALYWEVVDDVSADYLTTVHLLGRRLESVGAINRHPAMGMIPTSRWQAGQIWRDVYHVPVARRAQAPALLRLRVGLFDPANERDLPISGPGGERLELLLLGEARLGPAPDAEPPAPAVSHTATFEQGIVLEGYDLSPQPAQPGDVLALTLYWRATAQPDRDYTVFVHLLSGQEQIGGADSPPLSGDYPTRLWRAGDVVPDYRELPLPADFPPGDYLLAIGWYDPQSGARLQRRDGDGDAVLLPLEVVERR